MSITRIFSNGVMGLTAQSNALTVISDNVANASTLGYKRSEAQFSDFRLNDKFGSFFDGAGVLGSDRLLADRQGSVVQTGQKTNAAILGNGFFIVQDVDNAFGDREATSAELTKLGHEPELTRTGDFSTDAYGHLVNTNGRALLGYALTDDNVGSNPDSIEDLDLVSVADMAEYVEGSSKVTIGMALPSNQPVVTSGDLTNTKVGDTASPVKTVVTAIDNEGKPAAVSLSFIKTAVGDDGGTTWEVYETGATYADGTAVSRDGASGLLGTLSFDPGGVPTGGTEDERIVYSMNLGGAFNSPISLDVGAYNSADGLRVNAKDTATSFTTSQDGVASGSMVDVEITGDGYVRANYQSGESRDFYRIPNGFVRNAQGLDAVSGTAFRATQDSGEISLKYFGSRNASSLIDSESSTDERRIGTNLVASSVEQSNTDISQEFTTLIIAQRTYSANSKVVSTADELTQTVLGLKG